MWRGFAEVMGQWDTGRGYENFLRRRVHLFLDKKNLFVAEKIICEKSQKCCPTVP